MRIGMRRKELRRKSNALICVTCDFKGCVGNCRFERVNNAIGNPPERCPAPSPGGCPRPVRGGC